jgi:hypothetical protein
MTSLQNWHRLYMAALYETDRQKLPKRIAQAEKALRRTAHDLLEIPGDKVEEAEAVDDALYALRALRHCLELNTMGPRAA